jgi:hypothetical protein
MHSLLVIGGIVVLGLTLSRCGSLLGQPGEFAITSFRAEPEVVAAGETTSLTWSVDGADIVELDNGIGPVRHEGTLKITPAQSTTYQLTAVGGTAKGTSSVRVEVEGGTPTPTPTPEDSPAPDATPTPTPTPTPGPSELCWELTGASGRNCAPCTDADQARTGWPRGSHISANCRAFDHWMPCRCEDGGLWPGVDYWRDQRDGVDRWFWEKGNGACNPTSGKCFCDPKGRANFDRRNSLTCQVIWPQVKKLDSNICEWKQVSCSQ